MALHDQAPSTVKIVAVITDTISARQAVDILRTCRTAVAPCVEMVSRSLSIASTKRPTLVTAGQKAQTAKTLSGNVFEYSTRLLFSRCGAKVGSVPQAMPANPLVNAERLGDEYVDHVVILVHGIRTYAPWQNTLRAELEGRGIKVELTNYGYFDLFRFWVPIPRVRASAINRILISIRDVRKLYPHAKLSFLAHSFGTYIVTNILRQEFDFCAHRIVFCGSVVKYNFPFHEVADRFTSPIINEVGSSDYWPALAESATWGYGSTGTYGFRSPRVRDRWHNKINHSQFLTDQFCKKFWVPFFSDGNIVEADLNFEVPPRYIRLLARIKIRNFIIFLISFAIASAMHTRPAILKFESYHAALSSL